MWQRNRQTLGGMPAHQLHHPPKCLHWVDKVCIIAPVNKPLQSLGCSYICFFSPTWCVSNFVTRPLEPDVKANLAPPWVLHLRTRLCTRPPCTGGALCCTGRSHALRARWVAFLRDGNSVEVGEVVDPRGWMKDELKYTKILKQQVKIYNRTKIKMCVDMFMICQEVWSQRNSNNFIFVHENNYM